MKKSVKQKWFLFVVALTLVVALLGFLYHIGFRITYAPELENSWDAISACAAWAGVGASFVAIWFAIRVPKKIAEEQNKIALFEKRYECFQFFEKCDMLYEQIKDKECTLEELRNRSKYMLGKLDWKDVTREVAMEQIEQYEYMIHQMQFLFPSIDEKDTYELYMNLQKFIVSVVENRNVTEMKEKYISTMRFFASKYAQIIWASLSL